MTNQMNSNQFRDDEIIILDQLRDGQWVKNIFPKIGGRLRLAREENGTAFNHNGGLSPCRKPFRRFYWGLSISLVSVDSMVDLRRRVV